jgi:hypothetical protein
MADELMECDKLRTLGRCAKDSEMGRLIQSKQWDFHLK